MYGVVFSYLEHGLPLAVVFHDLHRPLQELHPTRNLDPLMLQPPHTELMAVVSAGQRATVPLYTGVTLVLQPHDCSGKQQVDKE